MSHAHDPETCDYCAPEVKLGAVAASISSIVTGSYPDGTDAELVMRRRVGKVFVEAGELADAIEGYTGENPRKGIYKTREDVIKELLDCASASLCAAEYMTGDLGASMKLLVEHMNGNLARLVGVVQPIVVSADPLIVIPSP